MKLHLTAAALVLLLGLAVWAARDAAITEEQAAELGCKRVAGHPILPPVWECPPGVEFD